MTTTEKVKSDAKVEWVNLDEVVLDADVQQRAGWSEVNNPLVAEYADLIKSGVKFPPGVVFEAEDGSTYLADGFARLAAHRLAKKTKMQFKVYPGGATSEEAKAAAVWYSCSANKSHGQRRSSKDKTRAVTTALKHPKSAKMTDRLIAEHCGVSHTLVANIRHALEGKGEVAQQTERKGATGQTISVTKDVSQKRSAASAVGHAKKQAAKPDAGLAKIAKPEEPDGSEEGLEEGLGELTETQPAKAPAHKATAPIQDGRVCDADGTEVPDALKPVFSRVHIFHLLTRTLRTVAHQYDELVKSPAGTFLGEYDGTVIEELANMIEASTPQKLNKKYSNGWQPNDITAAGRGKENAE